MLYVVVPNTVHIELLGSFCRTRGCVCTGLQISTHPIALSSGFACRKNKVDIFETCIALFVLSHTQDKQDEILIISMPMILWFIN